MPRIYSPEQKVKNKETQRRWRKNNPGRAKELYTQWINNNPEKAKKMHQKAQKQYYRKNKEKKAARERQRKYGISMEQYEDFLKIQNNSCAGCLTQNPKGRGSWHVDHNHKTNKVRGLLCHDCNFVLGLVKDDSDTLERLSAYVQTDGGQLQRPGERVDQEVVV